MNLNDIDLNVLIVALHREAERLNLLMRDGKERDLFIALSDIEFASRQAQQRLNDLRYRLRERVA